MDPEKCVCWKPTEPQLDCPVHKEAARRRRAAANLTLAGFEVESVLDAVKRGALARLRR